MLTASVPIDAVRADEVPRFEDVYTQNFEIVWRTLRRMGVPPSHLDDAAQDVFLAVHRKLGQFEGRSTVRTWVVGIAIRVAKDQRRFATTKGKYEQLDPSLPDGAPGPDLAAATSQALGLLEELVIGLNETHREIFVLFELEELTAPEISQALGINLNTVYSRLRLARGAFERALEQRELRP